MKENKTKVKIGYYAKYYGKWYMVWDIDEDKGTFLSNLHWVCSSEFESVQKEKPKPYACPVCGATIKVERVDDGETFYDVNKYTGDLIETSGWSNGGTTVFCSNIISHKLDGLEDNILNKV